MSRILLFAMLCLFALQSCIKQETITYQAQFKIDTAAIDHFVPSNNTEAHKLPSGIWYSIDDLRNGVYPTQSDTVTISYTVKLIPDPKKQPDLKEADWENRGYSTSSTIESLSKAISGLQQGLILFPDSSSGKIYIPSGLAFGTSGHYPPVNDTTKVTIPGNANLLYEIKLISVKGTRLTNDIKTIDSYLQSNSIEPLPLHDVSGIRYTIDTTAQTSPKRKPKEGDAILVTYSEDTLAPDSLITLVNKPTKIALKDQITAWRIMLPKYLTEGSTITMYVPSGYAYGSFGKNSVPPVRSNANMMYTITLIEVN